MKNLNLKYTLALTALSLITVVGCSTTPSRKIETTVIDASDTNKPQWAHVGNVVTKKDNKIQFLGYVELDGSVRKSAAFNMADEKALSEPFRSLVKEFIDQSKIGESITNDESISERIIVSTRKMRPAMPSLQVINRYYEVVEVHSSTGVEKLLRVYSLSEVSESDYAKASRDYVSKLNGSSEMKQILDEVAKTQLEANQ